MLLLEHNKEAIAIRWKTLLYLALFEYFEREGRFNKLIVVEGLNFIEAIARVFAIKVENLDSKKAQNTQKVFQAINSGNRLDNYRKQQLQQIIEDLMPLLNEIRHPETHTLLLPTVHPDTAKRVLKKLLEVVCILVPDFWQWCKKNDKEFLRLGYFYYVVNENLGIDQMPREKKKELDDLFRVVLKSLKEFAEEIEFRTQKGRLQTGIPVNLERSTLEIIKLISRGKLCEKFEDFSLNWNPATL